MLRLPTVLIERGQPDTEKANLGFQDYAELPCIRQPVTLDDGKRYIVHRVEIVGGEVNRIEVREEAAPTAAETARRMNNPKANGLKGLVPDGPISLKGLFPDSN